jgi:hypothetical protein
LVLAATGQAAVLGVADVVTGTVIVQLVAGFTIWKLAAVIVAVPAVAVSVPTVHVPPVAPLPTTRPAGSVSVKLKVCVGLLAGCVTVKVSVVAPPTVSTVGEKAFVSAGAAAFTVIHAPAVPPPELAIAAVRFVAPEICALPLVLAATGQAAVLGVADVVTGTVIVQLVAGFTIWKLAAVIVALPAVAVSVPTVHVPPVAPLPTTRPAGSVSVKLKVCVGLLAGCVTVKVSVCVPPTVSAPPKVLFSTGVAALTVTH